jgi:hypothetical protein
MSEQEQTSLYGARGKKIDIGGTELQVDDEFMVATLLGYNRRVKHHSRRH